MAFVPVPGCSEVVINGRAPDAQTWVNVYHFDQADYGGNQTDANALATFFDTCYTHLAPSMHTDWHVDNLTIYDLDVQGSPAYQAAVTVVGSGSGAPLPGQIALCTSWRTNQRGKSYRGRTFLGGWTENASDGNGPSSGALANAVSYAGAVLSANPVVASRQHNNAPRVPGIFTPITAYVIDSVWDTLRSRKLST